MNVYLEFLWGQPIYEDIFNSYYQYFFTSVIFVYYNNGTWACMKNNIIKLKLLLLF